MEMAVVTSVIMKPFANAGLVAEAFVPEGVIPVIVDLFYAILSVAVVFPGMGRDGHHLFFQLLVRRDEPFPSDPRPPRAASCC